MDGPLDDWQDGHKKTGPVYSVTSSQRFQLIPLLLIFQAFV